jgi:hypothetical protein
MAGFAGGVQSFSGEAAGEMLESLFGPGGDMTGSHGRPARRRA